MFRSTTVKGGTAGFTLIEALVALTIVAIAMASISALIASSARGVRSIEGHLTRLETARAIMATLLNHDQLALASSSGTIADQQWRVAISPFATQVAGQKSRAQSVPQTVVMTIQSPNGAAMQISTIRVQRSNAQ